MLADSKLLPQTRVLEYVVCGVSREELDRDRNLLTGGGTVPDVMIAFPVMVKLPSGLGQSVADRFAKAFHAAMLTRPGAVNSNETSCSPLPSSKSSIAPDSLP